MSSDFPPYSRMPKCQWCFRQSEHVQKRKNCPHTICDRCNIKDNSCKSDCPVCWEASIEQFLHVNRICSGKNLSR